MNDNYRSFLQVSVDAPNDPGWRTIGVVHWSVTGTCTGNPGPWSGSTNMAPISNGQKSEMLPVFSLPVQLLNFQDQ